MRGFTGTQQGMTRRQLGVLKRELEALEISGARRTSYSVTLVESAARYDVRPRWPLK